MSKFDMIRSNEADYCIQRDNIDLAENTQIVYMHACACVLRTECFRTNRRDDSSAVCFCFVIYTTSFFLPQDFDFSVSHLYCTNFTRFEIYFCTKFKRLQLISYDFEKQILKMCLSTLTNMNEKI